MICELPPSCAVSCLPGSCTLVHVLPFAPTAALLVGLTWAYPTICCTPQRDHKVSDSCTVAPAAPQRGLALGSQYQTWSGHFFPDPLRFGGSLSWDRLVLSLGVTRALGGVSSNAVAQGAGMDISPQLAGREMET